MNFALSDEQSELASTVRRVLGRTPSPEWSELLDLGWVAMLVPEGSAGGGAGLVEAAVMLEEMGRACHAGPFLSSAVLATMAAVRFGIDDLVGDLVAGVRATVAVDESGHGDVVDRIRTRASRKSGTWRLTGTKPVVIDGDTADRVIVAARTERGLGTFLLERPTCDVVSGLDVCRRLARLELDAVPAEPVGPPGDHTELWRRVVDDGAVALAAESLGAMEAAFDLAVEYAKVRVQFDRPIATFQAIKHKAADMLERIELSRVGVHYAAWASDVEAPDRADAAAMAKSFVGRAANEVTAEAIQIHGGVGFTWGCDAHRHYRRAKANDLMLGSHGIWRRRLGDSYLG